MEPGRVVLRAEGVCKAFDGVVVLRGVDLDVRRGEFLAIVGMSGGGKTVLLEVLIGHLPPDEGRVLVPDPDAPDGALIDMADLPEEQLDLLRKKSAVVFQQDALYSTTVYENIALALREVHDLPEEEIEARARACLEEVGLGSADELLRKDRSELSGGMAKRVAIARALALRPATMLYDDPTAGLDPAHASEIHALIWRAHETLGEEGCAQTTIVVTHDKDLLRRFHPRVVMLHEGRVFFDGAWDEFEVSQSGIIRPYLDAMDVLHRRPRKPR